MLRRILLGARTHRALLVAAVVALLLLGAISSAFAGWITVNTNNGAADDFGAPIYTSTCSNANIADHLEIKNAWLVNDGTAVYYKLETCGTTTNYTNIRFGGGWDCNNDGDVTDPIGSSTTSGDRKAAYLPGADQVWLVDGGNNNIIQLSNNSYSERPGGGAIFEWQMPLQYIYPDCRASDPLAPAVNPGTINMVIGTGSIQGKFIPADSTPYVPRSIPIDYGDAINPDPAANPPTCTQYPTRIGCNGARHGTAGTLRLGLLEDPDGGNQYTAEANADDLDNQADEDGVVTTPGVNWTANGTGSVDATVTGGSGYLNCWVDWNSNSSWGDAGEKVVSDSAVAAGLNTITFSVPGLTYPNAFIARCRLAPGANQATAVTGAVEFGEVEDYKWYFGATGNRPAPPAVAASINGAYVRLSWSHITSNEGYLVLSSATPYFMPGDAGVTTVVSPNNSYYDDANVLGAPGDHRFYLVEGQVTSSTSPTALVSVPSNRTAIWEYDLLPGQ